ncbi:MAG: MarR family transcriptional regulator [Thaumarchaeota archaeon]|nr:MarR family transcriptional regulator [Nitrososphaerota archaeon]
MGGAKKKSMSQSEKSQGSTGSKDSQPTKKEKKGKESHGSAPQKQVFSASRLDEKETLKALIQLKAVTLGAAARALGVNGSVAMAALRSLESKGLITRIGGYSGHQVWAASSPPAPGK